jgi:hypothetical protein
LQQQKEAKISERKQEEFRKQQEVEKCSFKPNLSSTKKKYLFDPTKNYVPVTKRLHEVPLVLKFLTEDYSKTSRTRSTEKKERGCGN